MRIVQHFTILIRLPFHHFTINFVYRFTIFPYQFVYHYTISLNNFSSHINQHLYKYYILTNRLGKYSESDDSHKYSSTPKYAKAESKYETSLHITQEFMDNFPNINSIKTNDYASSKMFHCVCVFFQPPSRGLCPNYEVVEFQP